MDHKVSGIDNELDIICKQIGNMPPLHSFTTFLETLEMHQMIPRKQMKWFQSWLIDGGHSQGSQIWSFMKSNPNPQSTETPSNHKETK